MSESQETWVSHQLVSRIGTADNICELQCLHLQSGVNWLWFPYCFPLQCSMSLLEEEPISDLNPLPGDKFGFHKWKKF